MYQAGLPQRKICIGLRLCCPEICSVRKYQSPCAGIEKSDKNKKATSNKNKDSKVDRPVKWNHNKHTFTVSGTEFCVEERYELIKQIGIGSYSVVCSCYDKKENRNVEKRRRTIIKK